MLLRATPMPVQSIVFKRIGRLGQTAHDHAALVHNRVFVPPPFSPTSEVWYVVLTCKHKTVIPTLVHPTVSLGTGLLGGHVIHLVALDPTLELEQSLPLRQMVERHVVRCQMTAHATHKHARLTNWQHW